MNQFFIAILDSFITLLNVFFPLDTSDFDGINIALEQSDVELMPLDRDDYFAIDPPTRQFPDPADSYTVELMAYIGHGAFAVLA